MKDKKELLEKHAKELAQLEREEKIRASLPEQYQEDALIHFPHLPFVGVKLWNNFRTQKTLADAVEMVNLFAPYIVECGHWKSGCISTWPDAVNTCIKDDNSVMDGSHFVEISVQGGKGFGPDVAIEFWCDLPELGLVEFSCPVCDLHKLVPGVYATYNNHGDLSKCDIRWPAESRCVDTFRTWWSEKPAYRGSYYLADLPNFLSWAGAINAPKSMAIN